MIRPKFVGEEMQINLSEDPLSEQHHCTETEVTACAGRADCIKAATKKATATLANMKSSMVIK